jgi:hypothetical protein
MNTLPAFFPSFRGRGSIVLSVLAACAVTGASADPCMQGDTVTAAPGAAAALPLRLTGGAEPCAGFNATVALPGRVALSAVRKGSLTAPAAFLITHHEIDDGSRRVAVLCYADAEVFTAEGTLCAFDVQLPLTLEPGDYPYVIDAPDHAAPVRDSHALSDATGGTARTHTVSNGLLRVRFAGTPNDTDGNGIDDAWEIRYFGGLTGASHTTDFDRDGLSDYYEFQSDTDPTATNSCLNISAIAALPTVEGEEILLEWYSISGRTYRVERATTLRTADPFSPLSGSIPATPPRNQYYNALPPDDAHRFYRVVLEP